VEFLSDEWLAALDQAARDRPSADHDPVAGIDLRIEQVVRDGPRWRLVIEGGAMRVDREPDDTEPDIRLTSDRATAAAIAAGTRAALDAFITGDLVIGGDVRAMLDHREALEALGDLFADLRTRTTFA
jgi:predicted lipid carrier protein YhbT